LAPPRGVEPLFPG